MTSVRDGYRRYDPDSTLNGFLPFWGIVLFILSCKFFASIHRMTDHCHLISSRVFAHRRNRSDRISHRLPIAT
jgi:hypothetical protein